MNFIYSLKLKNIDVDYLYQKECLREESVEKKKLFSESKESIPTI